MVRASILPLKTVVVVLSGILIPPAFAKSGPDAERLVEQGIQLAGSLLPGIWIGGPPALPVPVSVRALPKPVIGQEPTLSASAPDPLEEALGKADLPDKIKEAATTLQGILRAHPAASQELGHLIRTLTRFLKEKHPIHFQKEVGAVARVWRSGETDQPIEVTFDDEYKDLHPLLLTCILAHELQHVYDRYEGRVYSLDSELRGYRAGAVCTMAMTQEFQDGLREIESGEKSTTLNRSILRDEQELMETYYQKSLQEFVRTVKYGRNYMSHGEGNLTTLLSLREALASDSEPRERLAHKQEKLVQLEALLAQMRSDLAQLKTQWDNQRTRELEIRITQRTHDIVQVEKKIADYRTDTSSKDMWLRRVRRESEWLERKDREAKYNLYLAVDSDYTGRK